MSTLHKEHKGTKELEWEKYFSLGKSTAISDSIPNSPENMHTINIIQIGTF